LDHLRPPDPINLSAAQQVYNTKKQIFKLLCQAPISLSLPDRWQLTELIYLESCKYGFDPLLIAAIIKTESNFRSFARSPVGALGLMQLRPPTAQAMARERGISWQGKHSLHDPYFNLRLGIYYLAKLIRRFGNLELALAAYNLGPTHILRLQKYGRIPRRYTSKVLRHYQRLSSAGSGAHTG